MVTTGEICRLFANDSGLTERTARPNMLMRGTHIVLTALLISVMALVSGPPAAAHDPSFRITGDAFYAHSLATDGEYIAWRSGNTTPSSRAWGLNVARVSDATQIFSTVVAGGTHAVGDDKVIWERQFHGVDENNQTIADPGIYGQDLPTGEPFTVTTERTYSLAMHGSVVVWVVCGPTGYSDCAIRMRDLAGGDASTIADIQRNYDGGSLRYNGDVVTWQETESRDDGPAYLMRLRPGDEPVQLLTDNRTGRIWWYGLLNDLVAWTDSDGYLNVRDLNTGATRVLAGPYSYPFTTDGRYLVWRVESNETDATPPTVALHAWDSLTDSQFTIVTYPPTTGDPPFPVYLTDAAFANGVLTWRYFSDDDRGKQIRAAYLADVLPTGREPDPGTTDPAWTYYPETGHYLSQGFRDYWEANGGLPVFGYPLTEEYYQQDVPAQFTERQRFEWRGERRDPIPGIARPAGCRVAGGAGP